MARSWSVAAFWVIGIVCLVTGVASVGRVAIVLVIVTVAAAAGWTVGGTSTPNDSSGPMGPP